MNMHEVSISNSDEMTEMTSITQRNESYIYSDLSLRNTQILETFIQYVNIVFEIQSVLSKIIPLINMNKFLM